MTQQPDLASREHRVRSSPSRKFGEIEIDHARPAGLRARASSMACALARSAASGFSTNTGLPRSSARSAIVGLQIRRDRDGNGVDGRVVDQRLPVADTACNVRSARKLGGARRIGAGERHDLATPIGRKAGSKTVLP